MKLTSLKYIFPILAIAVLVVGPIGIPVVSATNILTDVPTSYTPLAPLPDVTSDNLKLATNVDFKSYVTYAFNLLIALGAVAAVFMITWGGFEYMTSVSVDSKSGGIKKVQNAIYGLILILSSWLILRTIDPRFVEVPATLVPALQLNQTKNVLSDSNYIMSKILADVARYNSQYLGIATEVNQLNTDIIQKQSQIVDLQKQLDLIEDPDSQEASDISTEIDDLQDQIANNQADMILKTKVGDMVAILADASKAPNINDKTYIDSVISQIKAQGKEGIDLLNQSNANTYGQIQTLKDQTNASIAKLQMLEVYQSSISDSSVDSTSVVRSFFSNISDTLHSQTDSAFIPSTVNAIYDSSGFGQLDSAKKRDAYNNQIDAIANSVQIQNQAIKLDLLKTQSQFHIKTDSVKK